MPAQVRSPQILVEEALDPLFDEYGSVLDVFFGDLPGGYEDPVAEVLYSGQVPYATDDAVEGLGSSALVAALLVGAGAGGYALANRYMKAKSPTSDDLTVKGRAPMVTKLSGGSLDDMLGAHELADMLGDASVLGAHELANYLGDASVLGAHELANYLGDASVLGARGRRRRRRHHGRVGAFSSAMFHKLASPAAAAKVVAAANSSDPAKRRTAAIIATAAKKAADRGDTHAKAAVAHIKAATGAGQQGVLVKPGGGVVRGKRWKEV